MAGQFCARQDSERKEYDLAISELNEYISNLKAKHGKLREFPPKTCFDATKNFDLDKIFVDPTGEGKPPCEYLCIKLNISISLRFEPS